MGCRYVFFRAYFELAKKTGLLKKRFPINPSVIDFDSFNTWQQKAKPFLFDSVNSICTIEDISNLSQQAQEIKNGNITFFSSTVYHLGKHYNWITNPDTGYQYNIDTHWLNINDYSLTNGDIKYVWEKSRFSFIYTLIRDEHHNKNYHAEFIFSEILDWIDKNPVNQGPNWKCSQEISIRVLNWIFALYYYKNKASINEAQWQKIVNSIYRQIEHVYSNINFSRIAVRNNHAITETLALYIVATLFPDWPQSKKWKVNGKKWFEKEIKYQIYNDGTFLQFSMNYHRVVIQLLTWAIGIAHANGEEFADFVYTKAYQSVNFLYQCQDEATGFLPNYGANDGALFFPLNSLHYRDYRPQLNALHVMLTGKSLYTSNSNLNEDAAWLASKKISNIKFEPLALKQGITGFEEGGYYIIRNANSLTFIRCGNHKDRPSQADNLHIDIWVNGENILVDGGSYKYNCDVDTLQYFMGTGSHNTVMIGNDSQMLKGSRFIWYYWSQRNSVTLIEEESCFKFIGCISCFKFLQSNILHKREVMIDKNNLLWKISDTIQNYSGHKPIKQLWHLGPCTLKDSVKIYITNAEIENIKLVNTTGWYSSLYGHKEPIKQIVAETLDKSIQTTISL